MYTELFKLCGFGREEIEKQRPRIDKAFNILEIGAKDIEVAEKRLPQQLDLSLEGIRKVLRLWLLELLDLVLAKEEDRKTIYFTAPNVPFEPMEAVRYAAVQAGKDVYVGDPAFLEATVMGLLFDRHDAIVEVGEATLPPGNGHCLMSQSKAGGLAKGYIPLPDLEICCGYYCDQVPETEDLLSHAYGFPIVFLDSTYDAGWEEWPDVAPRRVEYFRTRYRKALDVAEEVIGEKINDDVIKEGRRRYMQAVVPYIEIRDLMACDPPPISAANVVPFFYMFFNPLVDKMAWMDACRTLYKEAKARAEKRYGVVPKGAPKVLFPLIPNVDTSIATMIEAQGLSIPTMILMHPTKAERTRKRTFTDPLGAIIESFLQRTWYCLNFLPVKTWVLEMHEMFNFDGILFTYQAVCRINACNNNPVMLKEAIIKETGLPFLIVESDYHCTRTYPTEEMRTRVETFAEVVKAHQAAREGKI